MLSIFSYLFLSKKYFFFSKINLNSLNITSSNIISFLLSGSLKINLDFKKTLKTLINIENLKKNYLFFRRISKDFFTEDIK